MTKFPFYPPEKASFYEAYSLEYKFDVNEPTPWKPISKEIRHSNFCLITTCACRLSSQTPFQIDRQKGSAEYREISIYTPRENLIFDWANSVLSEARKDINILLPIDRFLDLVQKNNISSLSETFFSFCGFCEDIDALRNQASELSIRLNELGVDIAVITSATHLCNQTAGIIAREIEKRMISTICVMSIKEVALELRVPRAVVINFPFGMLFGQPFATPLQNAIVQDILTALKNIDRPAKVVELPYKWQV